MGVESGLDSRLTTAESDIDSLEAALASEVSRATSAEEALDARVLTLENAPVSVIIEDEKHSVTSTLTHVMLDFKADKIFKVVVGRMNAMKGEDYVVSEEGGKTKLTWIGSFAEGGVEALESGDSVFCTYATLESSMPIEGGEPEDGDEEPSTGLVPFSVANPEVYGMDGVLWFASNSSSPLTQGEFDKIIVGRNANIDFGGSTGVIAVVVTEKDELNKTVRFVLAGPAGEVFYFSQLGYPLSVEFFVDA
jgi:hypothetical protein